MNASSTDLTRPRRAVTRDNLIRAALEAIAERGFQRTSIDDIAARAKVTKGAFYDNFASKHELFLAVLGAWAQQRTDRFAWPTRRSGTLTARMRALADAVIADAPLAQAEAPMRAEFLLYTLTHADVRQQVAEGGARRFALLRERVEALVTEQEIRMPLDAFVLMLDAMIPGLTFIRAQAPELATDERIRAIFAGFARPQRA